MRLTEQVDFKKWAQFLLWAGEAKINYFLQQEREKCIPFHLFTKFAKVRRPRLRGRRSFGAQKQNLEIQSDIQDSHNVSYVSVTKESKGLSFAVLFYPIWNIPLHMHLWTIGWLFLTLTRQPLPGLLYPWPCFPREIYPLWVITTMPVTILLNGLGFDVFDLGLNPVMNNFSILAQRLNYQCLSLKICMFSMMRNAASKERGWYLIAGSGAGDVPASISSHRNAPNLCLVWGQILFKTLKWSSPVTPLPPPLRRQRNVSQSLHVTLYSRLVQK